MRFGLCCAILVGALALSGAEASAREAAFLDPGSGGGGNNEEAIKVDPKAEVDVGETVLGVTKRTSVFFSNVSGSPVRVEKMSVNADANVSAEITANDCAKQGTIGANSRCSAEVAVTPSSAGSWSVDVLMTHNGAGRITRAHLTGKTSGGSSSDSKGSGLNLSSKDSKPVDFGDITVGEGKAVRSALMVNDSAEPITLYSIDVIEADNGLQRLDQGCAVDMELPPGASCPVTLLWAPKTAGPVSTDLIIRHSGKTGFAVVQIRGVAKGGEGSAGGGTVSGATSGTTSPKNATARNGEVVPLPPSQSELEKAMADKVSPVPAAALNLKASSASSSGDGTLHLIGTIGDRAVILKPNGETEVVQVGSDFDANGHTVKLIAVDRNSATVDVDGKKKTLRLGAAESLVSQARAEQESESSKKGDSKSAASSNKGPPSSVAVGAGGR